MPGGTPRPLLSAEFNAALKTLELVVGITPTTQERRHLHAVAEPDRTFGIFEGGRLVATAAAQSLALTVPGGAFVPMAALLWTRVLPSHRRRGLMSKLLEVRLNQAKERGEAVAGMWVADSAMHSDGRRGFGWATTAAHREVRTAYAEMLSPVDVADRVDVVEPIQALPVCKQVYDKYRSGEAGALERSSARWEGWAWRNPEHWLDEYWTTETGPLTAAVWGDEGYAIYRLKRRWLSGGAEYAALIAELITTTVDSYKGLWQWLFSLDLVIEIIAAQRPVEEPLDHLVVSPRRISRRLTDGLWLRILDTCSALEARTYELEGTVVLDVEDAVGYANGRFELTVDNGRASCRPSRRTAGLRLTASALAGVYLGGTPVHILSRSGTLESTSDAALRTFDGMLGGGRPPWCPWVF